MAKPHNTAAKSEPKAWTAYLHWQHAKREHVVDDLVRHRTALAMGHEEAARWLSGEHP